MALAASTNGACMLISTAEWKRRPGANCFTRALTVQVLLSRAGYLPRLRLGLMQRDGDLRAHAWVENHDDVVIGGGGLNRYVPLPLIEKL